MLSMMISDIHKVAVGETLVERMKLGGHSIGLAVLKEE